MRMPTVAYHSASSRPRGAPPETKVSTRSPRPSRILEKTSLFAHRPGVNRVFRKPFRFLLRLGVDFFVHPRHGDEESGAQLEQGLWKHLEERAVSQRHAVIEHGKIHVARGNVR